MDQMQKDWNKSLGTLLARRAQHPPKFKFEPEVHRRLELMLSDGSTMRDHPLRRCVTVPVAHGRAKTESLDPDPGLDRTGRTNSSGIQPAPPAVQLDVLPASASVANSAYKRQLP